MITLGPHSTPTEVFASRVVKKVSQATVPRYITTGAMSWIFIVLYYLPLFIKEFLFNVLTPIKDKYMTFLYDIKHVVNTASLRRCDIISDGNTCRIVLHQKMQLTP
ncbi:hypothetical protein BCV71DRAFT_279922 [Rhizopus microsporus]|uniref:Uncharacterized protein n=1 Tax=Rhizopus microsporus TaxID=58291 RepID=A0A1X0RLE4_RHIZD|nr:hypothetical protein BCV71DRAFT_279922 [Rhizopus microsporus]